MNCSFCGSECADSVKFCPSCGAKMENPSQTSSSEDYYSENNGMEYPGTYTEKYDYQSDSNNYGGYDPAYKEAHDKKIIAGLLAIFLGGLGIHKFYLGNTAAGVITLLVTLLTCGIGAAIMGIIALIEGILYLTKSDEDFYYTYIQNKKAWF